MKVCKMKKCTCTSNPIANNSPTNSAVLMTGGIESRRTATRLRTWSFTGLDPICAIVATPRVMGTQTVVMTRS